MLNVMYRKYTCKIKIKLIPSALSALNIIDDDAIKCYEEG